MPYAASDYTLKRVFFETVEAFTVFYENQSVPLRRASVEEGMTCCLSDDDGFIQGIPPELNGATYFALSGCREDFEGKQGSFSVFSRIRAIVFAVQIYDVYHRSSGKFNSGFEKLGWKQVHGPRFRLSPWGLIVGAWQRTLGAGESVLVPHSSGISGGVALKR